MSAPEVGLRCVIRKEPPNTKLWGIVASELVKVMDRTNNLL